MSEPNVLVDGRWVGPHGIGRFAREVLCRAPAGVRLRHVPGRPLRAASAASPVLIQACLHLGRGRDAAFFSPGFLGPLRTHVPYVVTIHDLIPVLSPTRGARIKRLYFERFVRPAARRAFRVLTVSEYSKKELIDWAGCDPARVQVVGNGVSRVFSPRPADEAARPARPPYLLYVGNDKPHKNVSRLIEAFSRLRGREVRLVLAAPDSASLRAAIDAAGVAGRVDFAGRRDDASLAELYRGASGLILVSLHEGFGLPVAEAMSCGTPVCCSNRTALPEVAGGAAMLVDPTDVDSIAEAMRRLVEDEPLRRDLSRRGLERAVAFSWDAAAARAWRAVLDAAGANPA